MNLCKSNKAVSKEVLEFMKHVSDIKEESITDFLVWKWRELDKRFNYISINTFNHDTENKITGADFDLEFWLVGRTHHLSLAVQAKKFIKASDSYIRRLKYPNGTKDQMNMLLSYSAANNKRPFYFIYSIPDINTKTMCGVSSHNECGVFMADAKIMEEFADGKHGKRASRDNLLLKSNPLHCLFCCPLSKDNHYIDSYFPNIDNSDLNLSNEKLPIYVKSLLSETREQSKNQIISQISTNEDWSKFKTVGVYDLRELPNCA